MISKGKRFINAKLKKLVQVCRDKRNYNLTVEDSKIFQQIEHNTKQSIEKHLTKRLEKAEDKSYEKYEKKYEKLNNDIDNNKVTTQKQYDKKVARAEYLYEKKHYELNNIDEKPKNPFFVRLSDNLKSLGKKITIFSQNVGRGIKNAGTKVLNTIKKVPQLPAYVAKSTVKSVIRGKRTLSVGTHYLKEKTSEKMQSPKQEIINEDWDKAIKEDEKREETKRNTREKLGMEQINVEKIKQTKSNNETIKQGDIER